MGGRERAREREIEREQMNGDRRILKEAETA